jgi:Tol biopolymer transport system component
MTGGLLRAACGAGAVLLLGGCGGNGEPRPDLIFVSTRDGDYAIYAMNANGSRQKRLTEAEGNPATAKGLFFQIDPSWSPDGRKIALASKRSGNFDIYIMNADGTGTQSLTSTPKDDTHPTWSPNGGRIAFDRGTPGDIYVMDADGSDAHSITSGSAAESQPVWSPDGRSIAFIKRVPGAQLRELWVMRPDGSGQRSVISMGGASFSPAWSPDSTRLAFAANRGGRFFDVYTVGADGKGLRRLTRTGHDAFEPAWSPDGKTIAFSRGGAIVMIGPDGNEEEVTDRDNNDSSPAWNPRPPEATG